MYYCSLFFDGLNFEPDGISPCCSTNGEAIPLFRFAGGAFPLTEYQTHIFRALKHLQSESRIFCRKCSRNKLQKIQGNVLEVEAPFIFKTILLNQHRFFCNAKCIYCGHWKEPRRSYPILETLKSLFKLKALSKACHINWGGGEPSILPEFDEVSAWLQQKGYSQSIHTNAIRFSPAIASMLARGRGSVQVSLDCATPGTFYAVKGVNKFDQTIETLKKYTRNAARKDSVIVKYVILPANCSTIEFLSFFELCLNMGITKVQYSFDFTKSIAEIPANVVSSAAKFVTLAKRFPTIGCSPFFVPRQALKKIDAVLNMA